MLEVKYLDDGFHPKRTRYSCNSLFIAIIHKPSSTFDREELGECLLSPDEFGCIDPPGPIGGFGPLSQEILEEHDGKIPAETMLSIAEGEDFEELLLHFDGVFIEKAEENLMELDASELLSLLSRTEQELVVEIVEYEPN